MKAFIVFTQKKVASRLPDDIFLDEAIYLGHISFERSDHGK